MTAETLLDRVAELLGFRVIEREHDAVLTHEEARPDGSRATRPATVEEVQMYLRIIGLVARLDETVTRLDEVESGEELKRMAEGLQAADARIKELMIANKGLGEEREFLGEVHRERINSMQAKHDAGLIAAAERMQEEWLKKFEVLTAEESERRQQLAARIESLEGDRRDLYSKLEHAEERAESAEEMAAQMNVLLTQAEENITGLNEDLIHANQEIATLKEVKA